MPTPLLVWIARLTGTAVALPLLLMLLGESGSGPSGFREWAYLALFPVTFSLGYLAGWRWPLAGGSVSLVAMAASLVVIGRVFDPQAYVVWALLCVPGLLFVAAGLMLRRGGGIGG